MRPCELEPFLSPVMALVTEITISIKFVPKFTMEILIYMHTSLISDTLITSAIYDRRQTYIAYVYVYNSFYA